MSRNNWAIIGLVLMLLAGLWLLLRNSDKYNWDKTYELQGKEPYDFRFFFELLREQSQGEATEIKTDFEKQIQKALQDSSNKVYTYICVSRYPVLTQNERELLLQFVAKGNQAFLLSQSVSDTFLTLMTGKREAFSEPYIQTFLYDTAVSYNFEHPSLRTETGYQYKHFRKDKTEPQYLSFFVKNFYISNPDFLPLASDRQNPDRIVFLSHQNKKGKLFFHLDLLPFTNYYMIQKQGFDYVNKTLAHLKPSHILWDWGLSRPQKDSSYISKSKSPLDFILERRELAFAWYILLAVALIFLVFGTRRLQAPIPVIRYRKNTSLNFVETISELYKSKGAYKDIAHMKMEHFLWFLRNKIGVSTVRLSGFAAEEIHRKTGVSAQTVLLVFEHYEKRIQNNQNVTEEDVILFNSKITNFYNQLENEQRRKHKL